MQRGEEMQESVSIHEITKDRQHKTVSWSLLTFLQKSLHGTGSQDVNIGSE